MTPARLLVYIGICILVIAALAGVEIAFASVSRINVELKRKQGTLAGRILGRFLDKPHELLGATLVALYGVLVVYGLLMTRATDAYVDALPEPLNNVWVHLVLDSLLATLVLLIFSQLLPKAIFRTKAEAVLTATSLPLRAVHWLLFPVSRFFVTLAAGILKYLFNVRMGADRTVFSRVNTEQFAKTTLQGHAADTPAEVNAELFENALELVNIKVRRCMVPRNEVTALDAATPVEAARDHFIQTKRSRVVLYEGGIDNLVGYVHHLDMARRPASLQAVMHTLPAVPEAMSAVELMSLFKRERKNIAWVIDEFGGTAGIVTMEDVLERLFGQIRDEHDRDELMERQIADAEYLFSGRLELDYLNEKYGFALPTDRAETLSGYIIAGHGGIPRLKERIILDRFEFDILLVSATRIESVKMRELR